MESSPYHDIARVLVQAHRDTIQDPPVRLTRYRTALAGLGFYPANVVESLADAIVAADDAWAEELARAPLMTDSEEAVLRAERYEDAITAWQPTRPAVPPEGPGPVLPPECVDLIRQLVEAEAEFPHDYRPVVGRFFGARFSPEQLDELTGRIEFHQGLLIEALREIPEPGDGDPATQLVRTFEFAVAEWLETQPNV